MPPRPPRSTLVSDTTDLHEKQQLVEMVKLLLDVGTEPDTSDMTGYTAIEWARYNQDFHVVNLLLQYNATQVETNDLDDTSHLSGA